MFSVHILIMRINLLNAKSALLIIDELPQAPLTIFCDRLAKRKHRLVGHGVIGKDDEIDDVKTMACIRDVLSHMLDDEVWKEYARRVDQVLIDAMYFQSTLCFLDILNKPHFDTAEIVTLFAEQREWLPDDPSPPVNLRDIVAFYEASRLQYVDNYALRANYEKPDRAMIRFNLAKLSEKLKPESPPRKPVETPKSVFRAEQAPDIFKSVKSAAFVRKLGEGAYAEVSMVKKGDEYFAVKRFTSEKSLALEELNQEMKVFLGLGADPRTSLTIDNMKLRADGKLPLNLGRLHVDSIYRCYDQSISLDSNDKKSMGIFFRDINLHLASVFSVIDDLHAKANYAHEDLKPDNIFFNADPADASAYVGDWGGATKLRRPDVKTIPHMFTSYFSHVDISKYPQYRDHTAKGSSGDIFFTHGRFRDRWCLRQSLNDIAMDKGSAANEQQKRYVRTVIEELDEIMIDAGTPLTFALSKADTRMRGRPRGGQRGGRKGGRLPDVDADVKSRPAVNMLEMLARDDFYITTHDDQMMYDVMIDNIREFLELMRYLKVRTELTTLLRSRLAKLVKEMGVNTGVNTGFRGQLASWSRHTRTLPGRAPQPRPGTAPVYAAARPSMPAKVLTTRTGLVSHLVSRSSTVAQRGVGASVFGGGKPPRKRRPAGK